MPTYVNVYEVTRHYGGPEEGGWWYNTGEPIESHLVTDVREASVVGDKLREEHGEGHGNIYSVLGGVKIQVMVQNHFARYWPEETPYYE